jgi:hypothetical protein
VILGLKHVEHTKILNSLQRVLSAGPQNTFAALERTI